MRNNLRVAFQPDAISAPHFAFARTGVLAAVLLLPAFVGAQSSDSRPVPARNIPVPQTVSPELQKAIAGPARTLYLVVPKTPEEWKSLVASDAATRAKPLPELRTSLHVRAESHAIGGVKTFVLMPEVISPANRNRVLIYLHGGGYVYAPGEAGTREAILVAHYGKIKVISVDYRMPPDHPFPAALEDAVAVWKEVIKSNKPANTGLFGTSAGGGLALATVLRLKELRLPLPGAIEAGTPWADLTKTGDTLYTNEYIDNALVTYDAGLSACARLYAGGHELKEPLLSPLYGDFHGFPPTILISGTRDLFLSDTVRTHRKLRSAGVEADLHVFEGQSHAQYLLEPQEACEEISRFFDRHLGK